MKWIAIQPLTGGMYLGTEEVVGKPAECILSFAGLADIKKNKENEIVSAGNERHLIEYLKKYNRMPNYYIFKDKKMFQDDIIENINFTDINGNDAEVEFNDIDLVVAVPVCSGLSTATIAPGDTKNARNCNMKFIGRYTLNYIKPKILIMENAPQLYTTTGANMRMYFKNIAKESGYSVLFIKTDTQVHNNCQRRPRTFVMFIRNINGQTGCPDIINENKHIDVKECFNIIDSNIKEHTLPDKQERIMSYVMMDWFIEMFGDNWRDEFAIYKSGAQNIIMRDLYDSYLDYVDNHVDSKKKIESAHRYMDHVKYKVSIGKGYYWDTPLMPRKEYTPAMIFKTIPQIIHPIEDRFISIEEALALMGMPYDFSFVGNPNRSIAQIGQNVPVKTAAWVVSNALNIINNWETIERNHSEVCYYNNVKNKYAEE